mmetsp:Transcript_29483/g.48060  ORF Transcript_29483/g.48060 Transcript_29483/m.48060 type:complete len:381 (+) Transcript_29483:53-1195(+)|eukprot:CAMPEP_0202694656 /NCGR_PEP_ID=MMETSP1385-20130828/8462_1 /ASSEMBLY_ACC=CAM_ASM_000861 /TAXON_ID=933848 /ORGANISM="Elphidium margaritaceum" /LENGTH=380 /DNA_ID=CAMNT_0049350543 /DNA_START=32 /DNA_END=1174 /DNA_ORIENTATION=+
MVSCLFVVCCLATLLSCDAALDSPADSFQDALHVAGNKWRTSGIRRKKNEVGQRINWSLRGNKDATAGEVRAIFTFKQHRKGRVASTVRITAPQEATTLRAHKTECSYDEAFECIQDAVIGKGILIDPKKCTRNIKKGDACDLKNGRKRCDTAEEIICRDTQKGEDIVYGVLRWDTVDKKATNFLLATGKNAKFDPIAPSRVGHLDEKGIERKPEDYNAIREEMEDDLDIKHGSLEKCVAQRYPGTIECSSTKVAILTGGAVATACGFVALPVGMIMGGVVGYASHKMAKHMCSEMHFQTIACQCKEAGCVKAKLSQPKAAAEDYYDGYDFYVENDDEEEELTIEQELDQMLNEMFLEGYVKGLKEQQHRQKRTINRYEY